MNEQTEVVSFARWLSKQKGRDDPVGDLARDVEDDETWPKVQRTMRAYVKYLDGMGAYEGAFKALQDAWREYMECWVAGEALDDN